MLVTAISFVVLPAWGGEYLNQRVWISPSNVLSRAYGTFGSGKGSVVLLRRVAKQDSGSVSEYYGENIYFFDSLPVNALGFYRYTNKISLGNRKPMRLLVGDVDGDGIAELSVTVLKTTLFDPVLDRRPFFYNYREGNLYPLWLGSRLSRRFQSYEILKSDESGMNNRIVSAEFERDGWMSLALYEWDGFGFTRIGVSKRFRTLKLLTPKVPNEVEALGSDGRIIKFGLDDFK